MSKVRVGFIGAGRIADLHARAYVDNPNGELYAVADSAPGRAKERMVQWGAKKAYADYRDLLADPEIDAVEVILPHHLHLPATLDALKAGKHVSLQKPMALSVAEATRMVDAAKRAGKIFRVLENFHFYEPHTRAKEIIDNGEIGDPVSIRIKVVGGTPVGGWEIPDESKVWRADPAKGGPPGQLFDAGHHQAALAYYFLGEFEAVHAFAAISGAAGKYLGGSPAMISWKHRGGDRYGSWQVTSSPEMQVRTKYYAGDDLLEITGTRGIVWVNRCTADLLGAPPVSVYRDGRICHHNDVETDWGDSFRRGGQAFTDAIANGTPPGLSGSEGRHILATLFAVIASATEKRQVTVAELER
ncbi:MAG: Gfo/Idh/MocA family oxidoreductase [Chloroflexi bacterium]|nr:Gfo/Idh/MocA family oxidoreductase [Chloroflexota bacterium]